MPCLALRLHQPLEGIVTRLGPDEGFQSEFSESQCVKQCLSVCQSHQAMSWCIYLCVGFGVCMVACVSGGYEKVHVLCWH